LTSLPYIIEWILIFHKPIILLKIILSRVLSVGSDFPDASAFANTETF